MCEDYARLGLTGDSIELKVWGEMTEKEKAEAVHVKALSRELSAHSAEYIVRACEIHEDLLEVCKIAMLVFDEYGPQDAYEFAKSTFIKAKGLTDCVDAIKKASSCESNPKS